MFYPFLRERNPVLYNYTIFMFSEIIINFKFHNDEKNYANVCWFG